MTRRTAATAPLRRIPALAAAAATAGAVLLLLRTADDACAFRLPGVPGPPPSSRALRVRCKHRLWCRHKADEDDASVAGAAAPPTVTTVSGLECVRVTLELPGGLGLVTVLEATARSQDALVELALLRDKKERDGDEIQGGGTGDEERDGVARLVDGGAASNPSLLRLRRGDVYGSVLWPSALATAAHLLEHDLVRNRTVLEVGSGTGLVSLAALQRGGASRVLATDYEELPLALLRAAADAATLPANATTTAVLETRLWDIAGPGPLPSTGPVAFDVLVAADVLYEPSTGLALARRVVEALTCGTRVVVGDSPGRPGRPDFLRELVRRGVPPALARFRPRRRGGTDSLHEPHTDLLDLDPDQWRPPPLALDARRDVDGFAAAVDFGPIP